MAVLKLCDYGCGQEAMRQFKNGKWCCSEKPQRCLYIKEKKKQTSIEKYGVGCSFQNREVQEKYKQTCLGKYGTENPLQSKEVQGKRKQTCLRKYGVDHNFKNKEVQGKRKQTWLKTHGVDNPSKNKEVQEKMKQTNLKNLGVANSLRSKEVREKIKQTNIEKFGVENYKQSLEAKEKFLERHSFLCLIEEIRIEDNQFKVHCKNSNCKNSKEKGGWFTPTSLQVNNRTTSLETEDGSDGSFFYCSQYCKDTCLAFNIHSDPKRDNQLPYTQEQYETFRLHVLTRDKYICQFCGEPATDVHHEIPVKLQPFHAVDPCYGWSCCEKCHYAKGHPKGTACSTGNLAAVVCKPIKRKNAP